MKNKYARNTLTNILIFDHSNDGKLTSDIKLGHNLQRFGAVMRPWETNLTVLSEHTDVSQQTRKLSKLYAER